MLINPTEIKTKAGTQKSPQQTAITDAAFTDTDHVRFTDDQHLTTLPPYAVAGATADYATITGSVRGIHAARLGGSNQGDYFVFGGSKGFWAIKSGYLYNITPFAGQTNERIGANPFSVHSGSPTLTVTYAAHGLSVGDYVTISGSTNVDAISAATYINVRHVVATTPTADTFTVTMGTNAGSTTTGGGSLVSVFSERKTATLGASPIATSTSGDGKTVTVTYTAHGLAIGDRIKLSGATDVGGITASTNINIEHIVATVPTANTFTIRVASAASSTTSGGGSAVVIFKAVQSGNVDQGAAAGYGVGLYGEGIYGVGGAPVNAQSFPRIPSYGVQGNDMVMCFGDYLAGDGQKIYVWDGDTSVAPTVLLDAPTDCHWVDCINNCVVALCGRVIKISEIGEATIWSGLLYYTTEVQGVWKLIGTQAFGEKGCVIGAPNESFILRYTGDADVWDVSSLGAGFGWISPYAGSKMENAVMWRTGDGGFAYYDGSPVKKVQNLQNQDWIIQNANLGQIWKSFSYYDQQNDEWVHHFPTGTDTECSDYVIFNPRHPSWTLGKMQRTAAQRPSILNGAFYMAYGYSNSVTAVVYRHFTSGAVTFNWYAQSSNSHVDDGKTRYLVDTVVPDANMSGTATLTLYGTDYPQRALDNFGSTAITATTTHISPKCAGKLLAYRLSGSSAMTMGRFYMNLTPMGGL